MVWLQVRVPSGDADFPAPSLKCPPVNQVVGVTLIAPPSHRTRNTLLRRALTKFSSRQSTRSVSFAPPCPRPVPKYKGPRLGRSRQATSRMLGTRRASFLRRVFRTYWSRILTASKLYSSQVAFSNRARAAFPLKPVPAGATARSCGQRAEAWSA